MTNLNFNFSSESISNSLLERDNEKNILLFPFIFDAWDKLKTEVTNVGGKNILKFEIDKKISTADLIKKFEKPLPEIFDCDELIFKTIEGTYKFENTRLFLNSKVTANSMKLIKLSDIGSNIFSAEFRGYGSERFNAIMNEKTINEFYEKNSILKFVTKEFLIDFNFYFKKFLIQIKNIEKIISLKKNYQNKKIKDDNLTIDFKFWNNESAKENFKEIIFLTNNFKIDISKNLYFDDLEKKISSLLLSDIPQTERFISYLVVFKSNDVNLDEKFNLVNNKNLIKNINSIKNNIENYLASIDKEKLILSAEKQSLELQAEKLDLRKNKLRNSKKVYLKDNLIFRVPENEQETVLLFIKLASLGEIPLSHVNVLEYSTTEGIDAIADVKIDESSPVDKDCLIEFEPTFGQFKSHKHPPKHVDYIICWKIEDYWKKNLKKKNNWLYSFRLDNFPKEVRVIEISKFNNIIIKD